MTPVMDGPKVHNNRRKWIIGGVAAVVVVAVAAGLGGYFGTRHNGSSSASSSGSSTSGSSTNGTTSVNGTTTTISGHKKNLFGYWGQNAASNGVGPLGAGTRATPPANEVQQPLAFYCDLGLYDFINLAFLYSFGDGDGHYGIDFGYLGTGNPQGDGFFGRFTVYGNDTISQDSNATLFQDVIGADIKHCQAQGVKVVLAIGGDKHSPYSWATGDGLRYAQIWYDAFLGGNATANVVRPFGAGVVLDGLQLDVETTAAGWTVEMDNFLGEVRRLSPKTLLSVVPECQSDDTPNVDNNTGPVIHANQYPALDYILIQYYNNPVCSYPFNFNYNVWKTYYNGPIGLALAADESSAITGGFLNLGMLQAVIDIVKDDSQFFGISLYDVSSAQTPFSVLNYSTNVRAALDGTVVGSGYSETQLGTNASNYRTACGGQWNYVNETCGVYPACNSDGSCSNSSYLCFNFLTLC